MEETPHRHILQPLLPPSSAAAASPPLDDDSLDPIVIIFRLSLVAFIGIVSLWANHEASKGYAITIVNDSSHTFFGNRFQLFYVSNDEATRTVIKASDIIENFLFSNSDNSLRKKTIKSVTLRLVSRNLTDDVIVEMVYDQDRFVLNLNPSIMGGADFRGDVALAIRRGVARIWLWDGVGNAPKNLVEGVVEYLVSYSGNSSTSLLARDATGLFEPAAVCWNSSNPRVVAEFLKRGERRRPGFVGRLNYAIKDGWNDEKLGGALGLPVHKLCESLRYNFSSV